MNRQSHSVIRHWVAAAPRRGLWSASAAALLALVGCASTPPFDDGSLDGHTGRIDVGRAHPHISPTELLPDDPITLVAHLAILQLPLHEPLDHAWALTNEAVAPPVLIEAWHTNGLRVGVIDDAALPAFARLLPPPVGTRQAMISSTRTDLTPLYASRPLQAPILVNLTVPPRAPQEVELRRGDCQLLAQLVETADGRVLELTPHHHLVRNTLQPRSPEEKMLDGRILSELTLRIPLQPRQRLVLGLYRPMLPDHGAQKKNQPTTEEPQSGAAGESVPNEPGDTDHGATAPTDSQESAVPDDLPKPFEPANEPMPPAAPTPPAPQLPPLPEHLGRHFFAGTRLGADFQELLVITIESDPIDPDADAVPDAPEAVPAPWP